MIKISEIKFGWLTLEINDFSFIVSYLSDVIEDMNYLLGLSDEYTYRNGTESRSIFLDGEGTILKLSIMKYEFEDEALFTWWQDDKSPNIFIINFKDFVNEWQKCIKEIEVDYYNEFVLSPDDVPLFVSKSDLE